jgi:hypothetical protein
LRQFYFQNRQVSAATSGFHVRQRCHWLGIIAGLSF